MVAKRHRNVYESKRKRKVSVFCPKGEVDPGETFAQAAMRETIEEIRVQADKIIMLGDHPEISYLNYKMRRNGSPDFTKPKKIHLFSAYSTQRKFHPPKPSLHPYALWVKEEDFDQVIDNERDWKALQTIYPYLVHVSEQLRHAFALEEKKKKQKIFIP